MKLYCLRCRHEEEVENVKRLVAKNGQPYISGNCRNCDCKMTRFVSKQKGGHMDEYDHKTKCHNRRRLLTY